MKTIYIIHGWGGSSQGNWIPWLSKQLSQKGFNVVAPDMPNSEEPAIEEWVGHLQTLVLSPGTDTYFVGHSVGCQAIMRFLETKEHPVGGALFVAGWFDLENLEDEESKDIARPWTETPIDIKNLKIILPKSTLIISDNDDYGAFEENRKKFSEFVTKEVVLHNAEHITGKEYPEILSEVLALVED